MDVEMLARLDARMDRMEQALERMVGLLDQVQPAVAMGVDIADDWAATRLGGDAIERRLAAVEDALLRLTEPTTLNSLVQIAELGPKLRSTTELAAGFDDTVAMTVDIADEWIQKELGGDELEDRLSAAKDALLVLSAPNVVASLTAMAAQAPKLESLVELGASFDDTVAMAADIADEWVRDGIGGAALEDRLSAALDALTAMSDPAVVEAVAQITILAPKLLGTARMAADLDAFVSSTADVLAMPAKPVGFFGLLSALGDPDIQKGLGRVLNLTRHLGRNETLLPVKR